MRLSVSAPCLTKSIFRFGFWAVVFIMLFLMPVGAASSISDFQTKILPNRIRLVHKIVPSALKVSVRIVIPDAGWIQETPDIKGVSQILGRLLLREQMKQSALAGLRRGEDYDSIVLPNRTEFWINLPADQLTTVLPAFVERLLRPNLDENDLLMEKKLLTVYDPIVHAPENLFFLYLKGLVPGELPTKHAQITRNDLLEFHRRTYLSQTMTAIVAGKIKSELLIKTLSVFPAQTLSEAPRRLFPNSVRHQVLADYLNGAGYRIMFVFDLEEPRDKELIAAKTLPYLLTYGPRQFDPFTDRPLDYEISLFYLPGHYYLVFSYTDPFRSYSLEEHEWHWKNLERYCRYLQVKNFEPFLKTLIPMETRALSAMNESVVTLTRFEAMFLFDRALATPDDFHGLASGHINQFALKYLNTKKCYKMVIKAL